MSLKTDETKALRALSRGRSRAELKRLFTAIRSHDDKALFAAIAPAKKRSGKRKSDPLVRELEQMLKPILGPSAEKADMLVEHIAKRHRRKLAIEPKGLADAAKKLRGAFSDDQIRAGAQSLVTHLARLYGDRETVV